MNRIDFEGRKVKAKVTARWNIWVIVADGGEHVDDLASKYHHFDVSVCMWLSDRPSAILYVTVQLELR